MRVCARMRVCVCVWGGEGWLQVEKGSFNVDPINRSRVNTSPSATIYIVTIYPKKTLGAFSLISAAIDMNACEHSLTTKHSALSALRTHATIDNSRPLIS